MVRCNSTLARAYSISTSSSFKASPASTRGPGGSQAFFGILQDVVLSLIGLLLVERGRQGVVNTFANLASFHVQPTRSHLSFPVRFSTTLADFAIAVGVRKVPQHKARTIKTNVFCFFIDTALFRSTGRPNRRSSVGTTIMFNKHRGQQAKEDDDGHWGLDLVTRRAAG